MLFFPIGDASQNQIGIPETLITSAVAGCVFAAFACQPLIITGNCIYNYEKSYIRIPFLPHSCQYQIHPQTPRPTPRSPPLAPATSPCFGLNAAVVALA